MSREVFVERNWLTQLRLGDERAILRMALEMIQAGKEARKDYGVFSK